MRGRLSPEVSEPRATAALDTIFKQSTNEGFTPSPQDRAVLIAGSRAGRAWDQRAAPALSRPLLIQMGIFGLVLLIACANVADLLQARATARQREIGIGLSMGASPGRLTRQLLTESVLLASIGGAVGSALTRWVSHLLVALISSARNPITLNLSPDLRILGFAAASCLVTGSLVGLAPAFRATRVDLTRAPRRSTPGARAGGSCASGPG